MSVFSLCGKTLVFSRRIFLQQELLSGLSGRQRTQTIIPAPAGTGRCSCAPCCAAAGYPRICGDQASRTSRLRWVFGLSPRLRGSDLANLAAQVGVRVIPAPAGIGPVDQVRASPCTGYPRACGDRISCGSAFIDPYGLSPHLRGSVHHGLEGQAEARVIPAPAGIGQRAPEQQLSGSGYPRACGDRGGYLVITPGPVGLSPRLRGSVPRSVGPRRGDRVIPAPAGIGRRTTSRAPRPTGYPRACGDRISMFSLNMPRCGLSPRLRGSVSCSSS